MNLEKENLPKHIAIIMDGNRRWAKAKGKPAGFGHKEGAKVLPIKLADRYAAYQVFAEYWEIISADIEMLQTEGFEVITQVDPNMVIKKNNKNDDDDEVTEVQDGWKGHILPFELVQEMLMPDEVEAIQVLEERLSEIAGEYTEIIDSLDEDEKQGSLLNDSNDAFVSKELKATCDEILQGVGKSEILTKKPQW